MSARFVCDGCGKESPAEINRMGDTFKPRHWYQRTDEDGTQHACSRECIDAVAAKSGKTRVIVPL